MSKHKHKTSWEDQHFGGKVETKIGDVKRCFHDHPGLKLGEFTIYGGNAMRPVHKDADIYVSLDRGSFEPTYPWHTGPMKVLFSIVDMNAPSNPEEFKNLIVWLAERVREGKKVHVGCIGGHGRTGVVFAALVAHMGIDEDPIAYVRKNYCEKAVETESQVAFLVKHYGVKEANPSKKWLTTTKSDHYSPAWKGKGTSTTGKVDSFWGDEDEYWPSTTKKARTDKVDSGNPQRTKFTVWGERVKWEG